ncbi:hypothetical protein L1987_32757 [Smallanthus sonchifolius]|uniref:Uncharacterized protein n=1 Tax=Smallanthus sonchifolius TaxID=185202 RepID=A0ACB9HQG3_9ASTR|nr:hypothetical protein L1987_32757 [Smallanthus sonchifolius]
MMLVGPTRSLQGVKDLDVSRHLPLFDLGIYLHTLLSGTKYLPSGVPSNGELNAYPLGGDGFLYLILICAFNVGYNDVLGSLALPGTH